MVMTIPKKILLLYLLIKPYLPAVQSDLGPNRPKPDVFDRFSASHYGRYGGLTDQPIRSLKLA